MTVAQRIEATRAFLAVTTLIGAAVVFVAVRGLQPNFGGVLPAAAALASVWVCRGVFVRRDVVLWLESRLPELRYSLVALHEDPKSRFRPALEARALATDVRRVVALAGLRLVGVPAAILAVTQFAVLPFLARSDAADGSRTVGHDARRGAASGRDAFSAIIKPPSYTRIAIDTIDDPTAIAALVGSEIRFIGAHTDRVTMPRRPTVLRFGAGASERLVALEPRADSSPHVVLSLPARDTVLPNASGVLTLSASARDDYGIASGWFEMIVSSGDGESFKFRDAIIARTAANGARDFQLSASIRLDTLGLRPGDIVHLRAVARDANPASDAESGNSETRTLRVYRRGESDSVEIEALPPPEVGKSELSQRMLIIMTEKLVTQSRALARNAFVTESRSIGTEQTRLRKRVGQIIFTRLTGEEADEDAVEAMADTLSPADALLKAASDATGAGAANPLEPAEGDSPVIAVNRPLLEAFNAMWEAERRLGISEPRQALPYMRSALAAIQRARAAERVYLRGRPPKIVLDIVRIRLSGKKDGINPGERSPRASAVAALLERHARFSSALQLLANDSASAAIDSLTLLRVEALTDQPAFASALSTAVNDLRSGRDATLSLGAARRALVGLPQRGSNSRWRGQ